MHHREAVIKGDTVVGGVDTYADALQAGYTALGVTEFLVKQANAVKKVYHFTRDIRPCRCCV